MLPDTARIIHYGINFLVAPIVVPLDTPHELDFRRSLADNQLEFERTEKVGRCLRLLGKATEPLVIQAGEAGPQVGQLLIVAPQPTQASETFFQQTEAACRAFQDVWQVGPQQQVINRDACVRYLYQSQDEHAFGFLWERRLRQQRNDMAILGRPVLGGGLRLVMPPIDSYRTQVEVKIESSFQDSKMIFVELQFAWPFPISPEEGFRPRQMLTEVQDYCREHLVPFIVGSQSNQGRQEANA